MKPPAHGLEHLVSAFQSLTTHEPGLGDGALVRLGVGTGVGEADGLGVGDAVGFGVGALVTHVHACGSTELSQ